MNRMGYKACLQWILDNDDCDWLDDEANGIVSVTTCFLADIFGKDVEKVKSDLKKLRGNN